MERHGEEVELTATEASGGAPRGFVRYVLAASLALAIITMSVIWMTGTVGTTPQDDTVRTGVERR